jgi:DNA ligase-1
MQRRIGRKVLGPKILADVPIVLLAYDLLAWRGEDIREWPIEKRRAELATLVSGSGPLIMSEHVPFASWEELAELRRQSRERRVEGFMLKRHGSPYRVGRRQGDW